ncbi:MAG: hypothetical protein SV377_00220 [Halobacteria archaeon]|nr:hypothetical protein [Halobacteria archaeon]
MTEEKVRVWLVERTYSDDEQNLIILVYATPDGERYLRKERALTSFADSPDTKVALEASPGRLSDVIDEETRDRYAREVERISSRRDPGDTI